MAWEARHTPASDFPSKPNVLREVLLGKVTASPNTQLWRDPNGHAHMLIGEQNGGSACLL
jgi:hypothetical protein